MPAVIWLVCFWIPTKVKLIFSDKTNHNTQSWPLSASAVISSFMNSYIWAAAASHKGFGFLLPSVCVTVSGHLPGQESLYVSHYCGEAQIRGFFSCIHLCPQKDHRAFEFHQTNNICSLQTTIFTSNHHRASQCRLISIFPPLQSVLIPSLSLSVSRSRRHTPAQSKGTGSADKQASWFMRVKKKIFCVALKSAATSWEQFCRSHQAW